MIERAIEYVKAIFDGDGSGHDFDHTMRVYRMADRIAREESADLRIVALAALLHDVDDRKLSPETYEHKDRAVAFLRRNGMNDTDIQKIVSIISQISFSSGYGRPDTVEGMCVQDADRLDAMGAIGIGRAFAFGGSRGRRMHDPQWQERSSSIQHFYDKLLLLKDLMNTETGRRLAQERDLFMRTFLEQFYAEWNGER